MGIDVTWCGHATFLLNVGDTKVVIDPFLNENPSSDRKSAEVDADVVLLTHGHFDHVADAAEITNRCQAKLVANYEIATWFTSQHDVADAVGMNLGGWVELPFGRAKMTVAHHSSQLPDGSYGGNPGGFLIEAEGKRLYFAGDTALFSDMSLIADGGLDLAVLPIGDLFTMGPADSIAAAKILNAKHVVPCHYGTWPPIEQDVQAWSERISAETESTPHALSVGEPLKVQ